MENPKPYPLKIVVGVLIVIVLIILAVAYLPFLSGIRSWWGTLGAPEAVKNAAYLDVEDGKGVLYIVGGLGVRKVSYEGYSVIDYVHTKDIEVALLEASDGSVDLYEVSGDMPVRLTKDGTVKGSLDVSSDGTQIAYASKTRTLPLPTGATVEDALYNLGEWDVYVFNEGAVAGEKVGPGNHPRFYKEGLFYPALAGFVYRIAGEDGYNETDKGSVVQDETTYRITRLPIFSEDGFMAFPNPVVSAYDALQIQDVSPLSVAAAPENPLMVPEGTKDISMYKDETYVLMRSAGSTGVFRLTEGAPEPVLMFPNGVSPERIIQYR